MNCFYCYYQKKCSWWLLLLQRFCQRNSNKSIELWSHRVTLICKFLLIKIPEMNFYLNINDHWSVRKCNIYVESKWLIVLQMAWWNDFPAYPKVFAVTIKWCMLGSCEVIVWDSSCFLYRFRGAATSNYERIMAQ